VRASLSEICTRLHRATGEMPPLTIQDLQTSVAEAARHAAAAKEVAELMKVTGFHVGGAGG